MFTTDRCKGILIPLTKGFSLFFLKMVKNNKRQKQQNKTDSDLNLKNFINICLYFN